MASGLWIPRRQRPSKVSSRGRAGRARARCARSTGSDHRWFEERTPACTLLVYVDDATIRLMMLHFTQTESTFSYFKCCRDR